ncbi:peptidase inhibitor 15-A-like [Liolophura sinensis]|uniref:peptidase inhibitor 15-A-like n=1 Tax=Liolophura sinensis TaxID=3198878 RepID=UPI0031592BAA
MHKPPPWLKGTNSSTQPCLSMVVWAKSQYFGCGVAYCPTLTHPGVEDKKYAVYVVCNYSPPGNYNDNRPYNAGTSCSECPADTKCKNNLCSECNGVCGHYTQVVWAKSTKVGCGYAKCPTLKMPSGNTVKNAIFVACNYQVAGNYAGLPPFTMGKKCSKCPSGTKCKDSLCVPK